MGLMSDLRSAWSSPDVMRSNERRRLTKDDYAGFFGAMDQRTKPSRRRPQTIDEARKLLTMANPVRMRRLRSDYAWLEKQMLKLGLNPEDARSFL